MAATAERETILLVEDEPAIRQLMRRALEQRGYTVLEASNGDQALAAADRHRGPIHLLITDVVMPGMNGFDLAHQLTRTHPRLRVLFVSGHGEHPGVRQGLREAQRPFLLKPYTQDALLRSIREVLDAPSTE
jgi:two-component system cell cycle sensor histidine kinase/response regulator CckA